MTYLYHKISEKRKEEETITATSLSVNDGGKGLNQSIAMSRAGLEVYHAGMVGSDGNGLLKTCRKNGVRTEYVQTVEERAGNAIIQANDAGQNCIAHMMNAYELTKRGAGITIYPAAAADLAEHSGICIRKITEPKVMASYVLIRSRSRALSRVAQEFLNYVEERTAAESGNES